MIPTRRPHLAYVLTSLMVIAALAGAACASLPAPGSRASDSSGAAAGGTRTTLPSSPATASPPAAAPSAQDAAVPGVAGSAPTAPRSSNALERPATPQNGMAEGPKPASGQTQSFDRMIIFTTAITLTVKDVPAAVEEVSQLATQAGGYISDSTVRQEGERTLATVTLRVPAQGYAGVMAALRRLGVKVEAENGKAQDVTEEFADLDAQVRNLQVTEEQLRELMKKATTIDEIIRVQSQISTVRGQIERLKGRMVYLQRNAALATVTVSLQPELPGRQPTTPKGWDPLPIAEEAWNASLEVLQALATVGIRVVVFSWWLIPIVAAAFAWAQTRLRRPRPAAPAA